MDWGFVHKAWDKWASFSVGSSGQPLKAAILINYDPTGPSRLLSTIETRGAADGTANPKGNVDGESATHYTETPNNVLVGFADAGYLSDPHKGRSQTGYVFTIGTTEISWRST